MSKLIATLLLAAASVVQAADTTAIFQTSEPSLGPFPSNAFAAINPLQKTGQQVNMPLTSCGSPTLSSCIDALLLNTLDGFSVNPQITVCFSGPIDPSTLASGIHFYKLNALANVIPINQIMFDPAGDCAYAKPDQVLDQDSNYLLAVTNQVRDSSGVPIKASDQYSQCSKGGSAYCNTLSQGVSQLLNTNTTVGHVVSASLFTTMSATDWVQKAHDAVYQPTTPFAVLPAGLNSQFSLSSISSMTWNADTGNGGFISYQIPLSALSAVDSIAFGLYLSPNYLNDTGPLAGSITPTPTGLPISAPIAIPGLPSTIPSGFVPVSFHVFLPPPSKRSPKGFPVVIYGHGLGDNQFGATTFVASTLASYGIATIGVEITGHGYGPLSNVQVGLQGGGTTPVMTPGRGILIPGQSSISATDGCIVLPGPVGVRDCARQTAVDLFALTRTIKNTSGLGGLLDASNIYFIGQSFGSIYGTLFHAVEPNLKAAVLNVGGGTSVAISRLSPIGRAVASIYLATNNPSLLNIPPAPLQAPFCNIFNPDNFNDNYVLRDVPPVINTVPGAIAIDNAFEIADWFNMLGEPLPYASLLKASPKPTLVQFALGDLEIPNPTNSALIQAGNFQSSSWLYRFDVAAGIDPSLLFLTEFDAPYPIMPHRYLSNPGIFDMGHTSELAIAIAAQKQAASFFTSGGVSIPDPNQYLSGSVFANPRSPLFVKASTLPSLPEQLNFLQLAPACH